MNIVDWIYACLVYIWSEIDKAALSSGLVAVVVAVLRMRKRGNVVWSEALLCGVFGTIAILSLQLLLGLIGLPADSAWFVLAQTGATAIGAGIGWYGTDRTVEFLEDKTGVNKDDSN